ncbi:glutamate--cysteine ligase [Brevibacterium sp. 50QC2O2]|uniref:glutamate--cysteine ligase n=1 Tax=Brevibacterium TaxID=1696 RepID=UPI00211CABFB|nr:MULTISPECIES: glutamate--cysteine ligase [unclassified Brevibacterium]MCQ9369303.1 glutamate--cysteine ligase [Brevibacterium sp. 91QC2O2]MCQ9386685.1 glutamate--cysteine ligase [Brevibacterium sp. 68QC2CO]MCQ9388698.1 glutamate--cysteine ligase [Brevibacterium sp. 50QC2O2]
MGEAVSARRYTPQQRTSYRKRLNADLETFDGYLQDADFMSHGTIGMELELNIMDRKLAPAARNPEVLAALARDAPEYAGDFQTEIGAFNFEMNHPVLSVEGNGLEDLANGLRARVAAADAACRSSDSRLGMIGTLPTLTPEFLGGEGWMTQENRYAALSNAILDARGELVHVDVQDREYFRGDFADVAPEAACTSMQLHLQVAPTSFAVAWNASQAIAAVQVALAANSPLFLGRKLWHESRIPVFAQAIDTRTPELVAQGVRPRVWFGERWITSVFDLFEENVRYFPALLPESREDAGTPEMKGNAPSLHYLNLHNGTVWRWNRPIYSPGDGTDDAHLRVENRLLPAGPTVDDMVADAAFYYGLVKHLSEQNRPVWSRLRFPEAQRNFESAARSGLYARVDWPTLGRVDVAELARQRLIPQARKGLEKLGVAPRLIEKYMGIMDARANNRQNGAAWQLRTLNGLKPRVTTPGSPERAEALARVMELYLENQATGDPVHTWPVRA